MGSRLFRPSGEGRVVFSGQPEVDCTSWSVSQHASCYSYFRFVKVIYRLIRPSVRRPPRVGGQPKPRHLADCVAHSHLAVCIEILSRESFCSISSGGAVEKAFVKGATPPTPPCQGGFFLTPLSRGVAVTPLTRGGRGGCSCGIMPTNAGGEFRLKKEEFFRLKKKEFFRVSSEDLQAARKVRGEGDSEGSHF